MAPGRGGSPRSDPPPKTTAPTTVPSSASPMISMKRATGLSLLLLLPS